jgi:hypothetical protein
MGRFIVGASVGGGYSAQELYGKFSYKTMVKTMKTKKNNKIRNLAIGTGISFLLICCCMIGAIYSAGQPTNVIPTENSINSQIPIEKIIEMTFSAASIKTAQSYSPTPLSTPTLAPISTFTLSPPSQG